jgi:hypothetical protein
MPCLHCHHTNLNERQRDERLLFLCFVESSGAELGRHVANRSKEPLSQRVIAGMPEEFRRLIRAMPQTVIHFNEF